MLYFTSDHHFGHANIIRYCNRPFGDVEEMNRGLVDNWNDTVAPSDEVWVLGDVAMGQREETLKLVRGLHGRKLLLPGNHDKCWRGHKSWDLHMALYYECGFEHIFKGDTTLELAGEEVLVSHFPYRNDGPNDESFAKFRPADRGGWLLHGHVHDSWRQWGRMINTSVEAWDYHPVSAETIEGLIRAGATEEAVGVGASLAG